MSFFDQLNNSKNIRAGLAVLIPMLLMSGTMFCYVCSRKNSKEEDGVIKNSGSSIAIQTISSMQESPASSKRHSSSSFARIGPSGSIERGSLTSTKSNFINNQTFDIEVGSV